NAHVSPPGLRSPLWLPPSITGNSGQLRVAFVVLAIERPIGFWWGKLKDAAEWIVNTEPTAWLPKISVAAPYAVTCNSLRQESSEAFSGQRSAISTRPPEGVVAKASKCYRTNRLKTRGGASIYWRAIILRAPYHNS